jgi:hypothetical protein
MLYELYAKRISNYRYREESSVKEGATSEGVEIATYSYMSTPNLAAYKLLDKYTIPLILKH